jgi:hypothetical protein
MSTTATTPRATTPRADGVTVRTERPAPSPRPDRDLDRRAARARRAERRARRRRSPRIVATLADSVPSSAVPPWY